MDLHLITYETQSSIVYVDDFEMSLAAATNCDLVFTSPPYENARTYGNDVSWTFEDYQRLGDAAYAALKPGGNVLMVLNGPVRQWRKGKGTERSFMPFKVMLDWAERIGFRVPDRLVYGRRGRLVGLLVDSGTTGSRCSGFKRLVVNLSRSSTRRVLTRKHPLDHPAPSLHD